MLVQYATTTNFVVSYDSTFTGGVGQPNGTSVIAKRGSTTANMTWRGSACCLAAFCRQQHHFLSRSISFPGEEEAITMA